MNNSMPTHTKGYEDPSKIIDRFNAAIRHQYDSKKHKLESNPKSYKREVCAFANAINEVIEWALRYYILNRKLPQTFTDNNGKVYQFDSCTKYHLVKIITKNHSCNLSHLDYFHQKIGKINEARHSGTENDYQLCCEYIEKVRAFLIDHLSFEGLLELDNVIEDTPDWSSFYHKCKMFKKDEISLILLIGDTLKVTTESLLNLTLPQWDIIFDFDYKSKKDGFFNKCFAKGEVQPTEYKIEDTVTNVSPYSHMHYHFYLKNFAGSGLFEVPKYSDWLRKYNRKLSDSISFFARTFNSNSCQTIVVVLNDDDQYNRRVCEEINSSFSNCTFVFATTQDNNATLADQMDDGHYYSLSIQDVCDGFEQYKSNFESSVSIDSSSVRVPYLKDTTSEASGVLSKQLFNNLEEYFEVIHLGLPNADNLQEKLSFLKGEQPISWYGLSNKYEFAIADQQKKYMRTLDRYLENNSNGLFYISHPPGYGGTTIARRLAWDIRNNYPTLYLKRFNENRTIELVKQLYDLTKRKIVIFVEIPLVASLDDVNRVFKKLKDNRPVVFVCIKRRNDKDRFRDNITIGDWGDCSSQLSIEYLNVLKLQDTPDAIIKQKEKSFKQIVDSTDGDTKIPFYFALQTFEENFNGIKNYIAKFVNEISSEEQRQILVFLSIIHKYWGGGLPTSFFQKLLVLPRGEKLHLRKYFMSNSNIVDSLLTHTKQGEWKIKHHLIAKELLTQLLSGGAMDKLQWKQSLGSYCKLFIECSVPNGEVSELTEQMLNDIFIGTKEDRQGEDFTPIINDIPTPEQKEEIFIALKDNYPDNSHYWAHLARLYAFKIRNFDKAIEHAEEAIRINENKGKCDGSLYHIKGMCLKEKITNIAESIIEDFKNTKTFKNEDIQLLDEIYDEALMMFSQSREIDCESEYGYVANIQMIIRVLDLKFKISNQSKKDFLKTANFSIQEMIDLAESLLDELRWINSMNNKDDDQIKIENNFLEFYEDYSILIQNLNNQIRDSKNPCMLRRQVARFYERKNPNEFKRDNTTIMRVLSLLEDNLEIEPDNKSNYYLYFHVARLSRNSIGDTITKLTRWKANSDSLESLFYLYILQVIRAFDGFTDSYVNATKLIEECKARSGGKKAIFEWLGSGDGLNRLLSDKEVRGQKKNNEDSRLLIEGTFSKYIHNGYGVISVSCGQNYFDVFFTPSKANNITQNELNKTLQFYLGFSYDGLRADDYSVRLKVEKALSSNHDGVANQDLIKETIIQPKTDDKEVFQTEKPKIEVKVIGKIDLPNNSRFYNAKKK